jgi:hypothetical protein
MTADGHATLAACVPPPPGRVGGAPCHEPGRARPRRCPSAGKTANGGLGASLPLQPVRKRSDCRVRGPLPDSACAPGTRYRRVGKREVCTPGYAGQVRNVPQSRKDAVYRAYGISHHFNGHDGEVDHLVSLELGGTNATANLFPEAATPRPGRGSPGEPVTRRGLRRTHHSAPGAESHRRELGQRVSRAFWRGLVSSCPKASPIRPPGWRRS